MNVRTENDCGETCLTFASRWASLDIIKLIVTIMIKTNGSIYNDQDDFVDNDLNVLVRAYKWNTLDVIKKKKKSNQNQIWNYLKMIVMYFSWLVNIIKIQMLSDT